jgi:hypothetical protein
MIRKTALVFITIIINSRIATHSQQDYYPFEIEKYSFIRYDKNNFLFFNDSSKFENIFNKFDGLIIQGKGQLKIVHIGGSHVQADVYTNRIRQRLQSFNNGLAGARGFIFPYSIAKTNNPSNFRVKYTGSWEYCKNTQQKRNCILGLSGYSISTYNPNSLIQIILNTDSTTYYDFNRIKLFHNHDTTNFSIMINNGEAAFTASVNDTLGYTEYEFSRYQDELILNFYKSDSIQNHFTIYGISFENDDPGIIYNSVGVNGAKLNAFAGCNLFVRHLSALNPDLVIISLGTNDGYSRYFNSLKYKENYEQLLKLIKQAAPEAAVLLTVPNDSYLYRRYINRNTEKMRSIIFDLAGNNNYGVWDFFTIMGGLNSSYAWNLNGMMNGDKIHFNRKGYLLKGDLFFNAFLKAYENHVTFKTNTELLIP